MKLKIFKTTLVVFAFLCFIVGWMLEFIRIIEYFIDLSSGGLSYAYLPSLNVKIPYVLYLIFGTFLLFTTIGSYVGYKAVTSSMALYKEYKEKYADKIAAKKATRAEEAKQAKIKALEAELEELKND